MAIFVALWPYLLTNRLSCLQKENFGHTKQHRYLGYKAELSVKLHAALKDQVNAIELELEGESQNLRLINHHFTTLSNHFFGIAMSIFHKTEIQTVILRCLE